MTKRINYQGHADSRIVTRASLIAAGLPDPGADLNWNYLNGFELDVADPVAAYLLAADGNFQEDMGLDFGDLLSLSAANMTVIPQGEMIADDVQEALVDLYARTAGSARLDMARKRHIFFEDFVTGKNGVIVNGFTPSLIALGDRIGGNGFWVPDTATLAPTYGNGLSGLNKPGVLVFNPITVGGWTGISAGAPLVGTPEFRMDVSMRVVFANSAGTEESSHWYGLHDGINGTEPQNGVYLEYSQANGLPTQWYLVFAATNVRTKFALGVVVETVNFHAWSVRCDGGADPIFTVYYDDVLTPTNSVIVDPTNCPTTATGRFGPNCFVRKIVGTGVRPSHLDYFGLDWKRAV